MRRYGGMDYSPYTKMLSISRKGWENRLELGREGPYESSKGIYILPQEMESG